MSLQAIGVGFGRTGTLSLKLALERVGFAPCEHMTNLFADPARVTLWQKAARRKEAGEPIEWPGVYFWRELVAAFPAARVVLTVRDPNRGTAAPAIRSCA